MLCHRGGRDSHREDRTLARFALEFDGALVRLDDSFHQTQAQARPVGLRLYRPPPAVERLEDMSLFLRRDARATIGDADLDGEPFRAT